MNQKPTDHEIHGALRVLRSVDETGNHRDELSESFRAAATLGLHPAVDLELSLSLLTGARLLEIANDVVKLRDDVRAVVLLDDDEALRVLGILLAASAEMHDETMGSPVDQREAVGVLGEDFVLAHCKTELTAAGRADLARQVLRVSLITDLLGYDVVAPVIGGMPRWLEVKTTASRTSSSTFRMFLSRNEYEVGKRNAHRWAIVACRADTNGVQLIGWCRASALDPYLPDDHNGRWTEALVNLPVASLLPGVPSYVL